MRKLSLIRRTLPERLTRKGGQVALNLSKQSPHIFFGVGLVGFVGTTVLASQATLKAGDIIDEARDNLSKINEVVTGPLADKYDYAEEDVLKDRAYVFSRAIVDLGKLYGPTIVVGVISVASLTKSHQILVRRNSALTAAYVGLDRAYKAYKARVEEVLTPEQKAQLGECTKEHVCDSENALTTSEFAQEKVKKAGFSPYARFFDETSSMWTKSAEQNWVLLRVQQQYANDILRTRGHVFLNEVYDWLGMERSQAGAVVGWVLSEEGDNYIDFGFMDADRAQARKFVNNQERSVLLDFNVDGIIFDKIPRRRS